MNQGGCGAMVSRRQPKQSRPAALGQMKAGKEAEA